MISFVWNLRNIEMSEFEPDLLFKYSGALRHAKGLMPRS